MSGLSGLPSLPPAFFVPDASDGGQAEQVYQSVRSCVRGQSPGWTISDRRIYQLDYTFTGRTTGARVAPLRQSPASPWSPSSRRPTAPSGCSSCVPQTAESLAVYRSTSGPDRSRRLRTLRGRRRRRDCRAAGPRADRPLRGAEHICPAMAAAAGCKLRGPPDGWPRAACGGRLTTRPLRRARYRGRRPVLLARRQSRLPRVETPEALTPRWRSRGPLSGPPAWCVA